MSVTLGRTASQNLSEEKPAWMPGIPIAYVILETPEMLGNPTAAPGSLSRDK